MAEALTGPHTIVGCGRQQEEVSALARASTASRRKRAERDPSARGDQGEKAATAAACLGR